MTSIRLRTIVLLLFARTSSRPVYPTGRLLTISIKLRMSPHATCHFQKRIFNLTETELPTHQLCKFCSLYSQELHCAEVADNRTLDIQGS